MSDWRIIGLGSPLMGDDGIGLAVLAALQQQALPNDVELIDGGTAGLALLDLLDGAGRVILIDAVSMGQEPGIVRRFTLDQITLVDDSSLSWHQAGLAQTLLLGQEMNLLPEELVIFGIQPQRVERRMGISASLEATISKVVRLIQAELV